MSFQLLEARLQKEVDRPSMPKALFTTNLPLTPPPDENSPVARIPEYVEARVEYSSPSDPLVAVIGVGYVGTHLVEAFAKVYNVLAFDVSESRLRDAAQEFRDLPVRCTNNPSDLAAADYFLVSVPTILNHDKTIDTTYLRSAVSTIEQHARVGSTVIVESSVAVGMTRELLTPLAISRGLKVGMSPERVDPGRKFPVFETIPKIISGLNDSSLESIKCLYSRVFEQIVTVSSPEVAEMTKLYENCQRMVLAAYANEMADACSSLGIDAWEVSKAAASKPFGYLPFTPGPGIGGHCIPVNPYYLLSTCSMPLLQQATETSWQRPSLVANRFMKALATLDSQSRYKTRPRILVAGVGFKRGQSLMANSPGVAITVALMSEWEVYVEFADPLVKQEALSYVPKMDTDKDWTREYLEGFDGIIVSMNQIGLDLSILKTLDGVVVHDYTSSTS